MRIWRPSCSLLCPEHPLLKSVRAYNEFPQHIAALKSSLVVKMSVPRPSNGQGEIYAKQRESLGPCHERRLLRVGGRGGDSGASTHATQTTSLKIPAQKKDTCKSSLDIRSADSREISLRIKATSAASCFTSSPPTRQQQPPSARAPPNGALTKCFGGFTSGPPATHQSPKPVPELGDTGSTPDQDPPNCQQRPCLKQQTLRLKTESRDKKWRLIFTSHVMKAVTSTAPHYRARPCLHAAVRRAGARGASHELAHVVCIKSLSARARQNNQM